MNDTPHAHPADWTQGEAGIALQGCTACGHAWYFRREFCPACGAGSPRSMPAAGGGTVQASTLVHRAPDDAFRAEVPYALVLVELDEGVRVMAHGNPDLVIGDAVQVSFRLIAGRLLPHFSRT
jgi:uncharacterized OB-fold protein